MTRELIRLNNLFNTLPAIFDEDWVINFPDDYTKALNGRCDFEEDNEKYTIDLEVPGVKKEEINISLKNDNLTISWNRARENKEEESKKRKIFERSEGSFKRNFYVENVDAEKVNAELNDGVLKLILPKKESAKPKEIEIK
jgi:HSP20 family protein